MPACSRWLMLAIPLAICTAQDAPRAKPLGAVAPAVPLKLVSRVPVASLPSKDFALALPVYCRNNGVVAQFTAMSPTGGDPGGDPIAISHDGKVEARFGSEKIVDLLQPSLLRVFVTDRELFMLTIGTTPQEGVTKLRTPKGNVAQRGATKEDFYVVRFKHDGTYAGVVPLDVPFRPMQLGVFPQGDFLVAGAEMNRWQPRLALVASDGRFRRLVELKGDVRSRTPSDKPGEDTAALPLTADEPFGDNLPEALGLSQIVASGSDLLLYRPLGSTVYAISAGGGVRAVKLRLSGNVHIYALKPAQNFWVVELTRHGGNKIDDLETYAFDPESGEPLRQYIFPADMGFGLACTDGNRFTFVMSKNGSGVELVDLAP